MDASNSLSSEAAKEEVRRAFRRDRIRGSSLRSNVALSMAVARGYLQNKKSGVSERRESSGLYIGRDKNNRVCVGVWDEDWSIMG